MPRLFGYSKNGQLAACVFASVILTFVLATTVNAANTVHLTLYDDGLSCPGDCDAHVVFHSSMNGTEYAHDPSTPESPHSNCTIGNMCRICLGAGGTQCLEVIYRGAGPPKMTFDFTPKFYENACARKPTQSALRAKCNELKNAELNLAKHVNCIRNPSHEQCDLIIQNALQIQISDRRKYDKCRAVGEAKYNEKLPLEEKRSNACAYEYRGTGGPNSKGIRWRKLLPGVCRPGSYIGRDGLDCCNGNPFIDGILGHECLPYYPERK